MSLFLVLIIEHNLEKNDVVRLSAAASATNMTAIHRGALGLGCSLHTNHTFVGQCGEDAGELGSGACLPHGRVDGA